MNRWGYLLLVALPCACHQQRAEQPPTEVSVPAARPAPTTSASAELPSAVSDLAGTWRVNFDFEGESSCSRSFASSSRSGTYALTIDPSGKVHLQVDLRHSETFGPSYGAFKAGDRGFDHRHEATRIQFQLDARLERTTLRLTMAPNTQRCSSLAPDGKQGDPVQCPDPLPEQLECEQGTIETVGVLGAGPERVFVLRCPWVGFRWVVGVAGLEKAPLAKAPGLDVAARSSEMLDTLVIRRAIDEASR